MTEPVLREFADGVLTLTLNRPEAANAIRADQRDSIIAWIREANSDHDVRVGVLRSTGKHFCSGADVGGIDPGAQRKATAAMNRIMGGAQQLIASLLDRGKAVVGVVQVTAAGMGAHLAYACDLVVASEAASFIGSFVLRGLVMDAGGAYLLPSRIGAHRAKELAFNGDRLPAAEALALGLTNRVVAAGELDSTADELIQRLASLPTTSITLMKRLINNSLDHDRAIAFLAEGVAQELQSSSHDAAEGVSAFKERRTPEYRGF